MVAMQLVVDRIRGEFSNKVFSDTSMSTKQPSSSSSSSSSSMQPLFLSYGLQHNYNCNEFPMQTQTQTRILAFSDSRRFGTSVRHEDNFRKLKSVTETGRVLLSDRKGWTDHLTTQNVMKSVSCLVSNCFILVPLQLSSASFVLPGVLE